MSSGLLEHMDIEKGFRRPEVSMVTHQYILCQISLPHINIKDISSYLSNAMVRIIFVWIFSLLICFAMKTTEKNGKIELQHVEIWTLIHGNFLF
jgi:hypothetical protein